MYVCMLVQIVDYAEFRPLLFLWKKGGTMALCSPVVSINISSATPLCMGINYKTVNAISLTEYPLVRYLLDDFSCRQ